MTHRICEGLWLKRLLIELMILVKDAIKMLSDNQAAINIAKNSVHDRTTHVKIDFNFNKEKIEGGTVSISVFLLHFRR